MAAIQMRSGTDVGRNVADLKDMAREAVAAGAHYLQTPEMTGLVQRDRRALMAAISPQERDPVFAAASELAAEHGVWLHVGSTPVLRPDDRVANRAALFAPDGKLTATYDKIHMFDADLANGESWRESAVYAPGGSTRVVDVGTIRLGLAICYDLRFAALFTDQARAGANMLTAPSAFTRQTGDAHWHVLLRARAIENGAFVVAAAQGGRHEDGRETFGHSMIVDPWGTIVAEKADEEPGVIIADIDPAAVIAARTRIPNLRHAREYSVEDER